MFETFCAKRKLIKNNIERFKVVHVRGVYLANSRHTRQSILPILTVRVSAYSDCRVRNF